MLMLNLKKEAVKAMGLARMPLHNICMDRGDLVPRRMDLTADQATNKRRSRDEIRDLLDLTDSNQRNFQKGKPTGIRVRNTIAKTFWEKKTKCRNAADTMNNYYC